MKPQFALWPTGFTGRVILVLAIAIGAQFITASLLIGRDERDIQEQDYGRRIAEQLLVAERILLATEPAERNAIAAILSTRHLDFALVEGSQPPLSPSARPVEPDMRTAIVGWEPSLRERRLQLAEVDAEGTLGRRYLSGALEIQPDRWLLFETHDPISNFGTILLSVIRMAVAAIAVLATAGLLVQTLNRPLRRLSNGAGLIGTKSKIDFDESGPKELRRVSRALNEMQSRIDNLIAQRTRALAAVGHDLRTPLARLRLRLGAMSDPTEREAARRDCELMQQMLQDLLDFYDSGEVGSRTRSDLASLCETIADDSSDIGRPVTYKGPGRLVASVYHTALARAISNLVDNACRYAGRADLELEEEAAQIRITVRDDGPGIPEAEIERMRRPFERLDQSRRSEEGGIGLGLSIVERVAEMHGGLLAIESGTPRGLVASIILPRSLTAAD